MGIVMRIHERDGDDVRQLGEKADHLIMLLHAEDGDMMEVQDLGQLPRCAHRFLAVAFCRDDDVIGVAEHLSIGVFDAARLPAGHRVCGDELHIVP